MKYKFCILKNEKSDSDKHWINACKKFDYDYYSIDFTKNNWLDKILEEKFDYILTCPPGEDAHYKQLYDEKLYLLNKVLNFPCYPKFEEVLIYENKRFLSLWLSCQKLPMPKTFIFYDFYEANNFLREATFPLVSKLNIGASGRGVKIIRDIKQAINYINNIFLLDGVNPKYGPNLRSGNQIQKILMILKSPSLLKKNLILYKKLRDNKQKRFCLFQEYIHHEYEWRVVKIGDSYFAHQKIKVGEMASGSKGINYVEPPISLLNFIHSICQKFNFRNMSFDLFEISDNTYLINEMQTIFGHVQNYICSKNGKPGRFIYNESTWEFEEGDFNSNLSYDLRLQDLVNQLKA